MQQSKTTLYLIAFLFFLSSGYLSSCVPHNAEVAQTAAAEEMAEPLLDQYGIPIDSLSTVRDQIRRNDTLSGILSRHNVSSEVIQMVAAASRDVFDVRRLVSGKEYQVYLASDTTTHVRYVVYENDPIEYVVFDLGDPIQVYTGQRDVEVNQKGVGGSIEGSLYGTIARNNGAPEIATRLSQVYAWQIDFHRLRRGDRFKVIYEENSIDGNTVGVGAVSAAWFRHAGREYYAFYFEQDGKGEFFDEEGNSLRNAFLRAPLKYTRISSRFSMNRRHPILRTNRPHLGTDYAAPEGTPILSVGDGVIERAAYSRGNGRYVKVRHNGTYSTQYLHMSRIANGIRPGVRVTQGQVIGYVGQTGLATGPHLCYRFWKNGRQVDPFSIDLPSSDPVKPENRKAFDEVRDELMRELMRIRSDRDADPRMRAV